MRYFTACLAKQLFKSGNLGKYLIAEILFKGTFFFFFLAPSRWRTTKFQRNPVNH